jgi:hypothetical protein
MRFDTRRNAFISWSLKGSGRAFRARQELRAALPRKFGLYISKARKFARLWKWEILKTAHYPPELKLEALWALHFRETYGSAMERAGLSKYMSLEAFFACATGEIYPDEVPDMITHQTAFPLNE